ncbi:hypothetical protein K435DRAFT_858149 [Dendrothele bispora CBS 962.96]|uniref:Uncharacterized protein n=1 Tax=Dendrothele bispora (strain CBS 962.96) TaxID=1314807 RepID=A0A4S8M4L2_DENBC|nr:hypothetical protein K435DRAFT_858149 [Dendrothele bispora CBS 962.96]
MRRRSHTQQRDVHAHFPSEWNVTGYEPQEEPTPRTQQDQDKDDEEARRKATKDLVQSWMDRLQLISLITTFLASVEAGMLQVTNGGDTDTVLDQISNATFLSALVLHLHASFVSFVAAFFLIRFKVREAKREEAKVEGQGNGTSTHGQAGPSSKGSLLIDMAAKHVTQSPTTASTRSNSHSSHSFNIGHKKEQDGEQEKAPNPSHHDREPSPPPVWSANPRLVQVGPFQRQPPIILLSRCHSLCVLFATVGFVLAMIGIVTYSWAQQTKAVGAVTTGFLGLCMFSGLTIVYTSRNNPDGVVFTYE